MYVSSPSFKYFYKTFVLLIWTARGDRIQHIHEHRHHHCPHPVSMTLLPCFDPVSDITFGSLIPREFQFGMVILVCQVQRTYINHTILTRARKSRIGSHNPYYVVHHHGHHFPFGILHVRSLSAILFVISKDTNCPVIFSIDCSNYHK